RAVERAGGPVHTWWRATPGRVTEVRFAHSPGRLDPSYSNIRRYFDAMFVLALPDGSNGALAIDVKYREAGERHGVKPTHMPRFVEIHDRSGAFESGAADVLNPSRITMIVPRPRGVGPGPRAQPVTALDDLARAPAPAVDAPAREWSLDVGPLHRAPPRG